MNQKVIDHFRKYDPIIYSYAVRIGQVQIDSSSDHFINLCESIINQQLSEKAGATIFHRFQQAFKGKISPKNVASLSSERLRSTGISLSKIGYLKGLAKGVLEKKLVLEMLLDLPNEKVIEELTKIKGIGRWTAEMFLMFSLGREDIFSYGDLGLRRAIEKLYKLENPSKEHLGEISQKWSPYRTYACIVLWRSLKL
ncbi:DNA-3-methyladenine glycosylase 2 family protein [Candidatus Gottesmanbacteria bacterium]|nr:DNA-3-methyladenine glycosylase 2 family protein [Candidatus Gottesmanbacteria bacterium]